LTDESKLAEYNIKQGDFLVWMVRKVNFFSVDPHNLIAMAHQLSLQQPATTTPAPVCVAFSSFKPKLIFLCPGGKEGGTQTSSHYYYPYSNSSHPSPRYPYGAIPRNRWSCSHG